MEDHKISVHIIDKNWLNCQECSMTFSTKKEMLDHLKQHNKNIKCTLCQKGFLTQNYLIRHMKIKHNVEMSDEEEENTVTETGTEEYTVIEYIDEAKTEEFYEETETAIEQIYDEHGYTIMDTL